MNLYSISSLEKRLHPFQQVLRTCITDLTVIILLHALPCVWDSYYFFCMRCRVWGIVIISFAYVAVCVG